MGNDQCTRMCEIVRPEELDIRPADPIARTENPFRKKSLDHYGSPISSNITNASPQISPWKKRNSEERRSKDIGCCSVCKQIIMSDAMILSCQHVFHTKCLISLMQLQKENGSQRFQCSKCAFTFGAQVILQNKLIVSNTWYYCKSCEESCISIETSQKSIEFCKHCPQPLGLARMDSYNKY